METGPSQIAERVLRAEADASVAWLPGKVAGVVLVALGQARRSRRSWHCRLPGCVGDHEIER